MRFLVRGGVVLAGVLSWAAPSAAQSPPVAPEKIAVGDWLLAPTMEVRLRGEYRRDAPDLGGTDFFGQVSPRVRDAWVVLERSRLGLEAERGALRAQLTLQDARALGSPAPVARTRGTEFGPYEAYAEVHGTGSRPHYLRLGRQAVVWGEGRLIGNADFAPAGRALDAARGHLALGNLDVEALAAILEVPGPLGSAFGQTNGGTSGIQLYGLTARWTIDPLFMLDAFGIARVARSSGADLDGSRFSESRLSGERYTVALRASGDAKGWSYGAEGAYQFGRAPSVGLEDTSIAAWAAAAHVAKTLDQLALTPTFRISGSYASGDDGKGRYKQFDPLLADPQRFHGQMDLFAWSNMVDLAGRAEIVPWADTSLSVEYRYARLAKSAGEWIGSYLTAIASVQPPPAVVTRPAVPAPPTSEELGHEIDVGFTYRPWLPFEVRVGWSGLLLGDGAKAMMVAHARGDMVAPGAGTAADIAQYAYVQATLRVP